MENWTLDVADFFDAIKLMYHQFERIETAGVADDLEVEDQYDSASIIRAPSTSVGYADAFSDFDYDGFDYNYSGEFATPDEEEATVFDS